MTCRKRTGLLDCLLWFALCASPLAAADREKAANQEKLEIRGFAAVYDSFGPARKEASYYPGERMCCRYDLYGCSLNEAGQAEMELFCRITDSRGRVRTAFSNKLKEAAWKCADAFIRLHTVHVFPDDFPPGQYQLEITIEDRLTKRETSVKQRITIKPVRLALVSLRCFHDAQRKISAPLAALVEETLFFNVEVIGEDRTQGKVSLAFLVELLDADGNNVLRETTPYEMKSEDPAFIQNPRRHAVMNATLPLRHPGKYTLRFSVADQFAGRTATLEMPLRVLNPSEPGVVAAK